MITSLQSLMIKNARFCLLALATPLFLLHGCGPVAQTPSERQAAEEPFEYIYALQLASNWGIVTRSGKAIYYTGRKTAADEMGVTLTSNEGTFRCLYKDTPNVHAAAVLFANPPTRVELNCGGIRLSIWDSAEESKKLVRAWKTMIAGMPIEYSGNPPGFEALAAAYRADPGAYIVTEEVRAYKVQAETAVQEKKLFHAVQRFRDALITSPWWPQGNFNLALIYSELELYQLATASMEKYLKLVPDAPNARAAQDKIYAWRGKTR